MRFNGWLCVNKPEGITSAQLLNRLKRAFPRKTKIGHAGTLDKFACGVLPVAIGPATKTISFIMDAYKTYTFTIVWGVQTCTDDRDGDIIMRGKLIPDKNSVIETLQTFKGTLHQTPPTFSAVKINGIRASDRARKGENIEIKPRPIHIFELKIITHHEEETTLEVTCSKGTYVRALARDLAAALNTVGYVKFLRRDRVGKFTFDQSILLEKESKIDDNIITKITSAIIPIRTVLDDIPAVFCTELAISRLSKGQSVPANLQDSEMVFAVDKNDVIAIGFIKDQLFYPKHVFINGV